MPVNTDLKALNLDLENSAIVQLPEAYRNVLSTTLQSTSLSNLQSSFCPNVAGLNSNCANTDIINLKTTLKALPNIGDLIDCTGCNDQAIVNKLTAIGAKASSFNQAFTTVTGSAASNNLLQDIAAFNNMQGPLLNANTTLTAIGKIALNSTSYTPLDSTSITNAITAATNLRTFVTRDQQDSAANHAALNNLASIPSISSELYTSERIYKNLGPFVNTLKGFGTKIGMNETSYVGTSGVKLSSLFTNANITKKGGMVVAYKKAMAIVKATCQVLLLHSDINPYSTAQLGALATACSSFLSLNAPGPGLKAVCTSVCNYYNGTTATSPSISTGTFGSGVSYITNNIVGGCASLHNSYASDGINLINLGSSTWSSTCYASNTGTFAANAAFWANTTTTWFDGVSNSPYAWVNDTALS